VLKIDDEGDGAEVGAVGVGCSIHYHDKVHEHTRKFQLSPVSTRLLGTVLQCDHELDLSIIAVSLPCCSRLPGYDKRLTFAFKWDDSLPGKRDQLKDMNIMKIGVSDTTDTSEANERRSLVESLIQEYRENTNHGRDGDD